MSATTDNPIHEVCGMPWQASATDFRGIPGLYGTLNCGCKLVVVPFDPVGPRLLILGATHKHDAHDVIADFPEAFS